MEHLKSFLKVHLGNNFDVYGSNLGYVIDLISSKLLKFKLLVLILSVFGILHICILVWNDFFKRWANYVPLIDVSIRFSIKFRFQLNSTSKEAPKKWKINLWCHFIIEATNIMTALRILLNFRLIIGLVIVQRDMQTVLMYIQRRKFLPEHVSTVINANEKWPAGICLQRILSSR